MKKRLPKLPPARPMAQDRHALREEFRAAIERLKKIPAFGTPGRAGQRSK